jgi:prepilin-type N-terminal cleavage/methylation domain-containing protein
VSRRLAAEDGFTLMELLLVIAMLGIIAVPLSASILVGLRTTDATINRLDSTHDAQLVSIYLPADLQSAGKDANDVSTAANTDCSRMANLLTVKWSDPSHTYEAVYALTGGGKQLSRYYCVDGVQATATVVARNLAVGTPPAAALAADGKSWTLTVTEATTSRDTASYVYTITGIRRTPIS